MFWNKLTVQLTIKCGECPRTGQAQAELKYDGDRKTYEIRPSSLQPPADWKGIQVDEASWEVFCPLCAKEAL